MEFNAKTSVVGDWAKKGEDIKNSDVLVLLDAGRIVEGQFGEQNVFSVKTKNGAKNISMNQTSINALVAEYGKESTNWIGKTVIVHSIKQNVQGKFTDVYYFVPFGYEMGSYGFEKTGVQAAAKEELPTIQLEVDGEVVPF